MTDTTSKPSSGRSSEPAQNNALGQLKPYEQCLIDKGFKGADIGMLRGLIQRMNDSGHMIPRGKAKRPVLRGNYVEQAFAYYLNLDPACRPTLAQIGLAETYRQGPIQRGAALVDTIYQHSRGLGAFIAAYNDPDLPKDRLHMVDLATWHDVAEDIITDFTPIDKAQFKLSKADKNTLEAMAIAVLFESPDHADKLALVEEYDAKSTPEARIVADFDKILAILEGLRADKAAKHAHLPLFHEFLATEQQARNVKSDIGKKALAKLDDPLEREEMLKLYEACMPKREQGKAR